MTFPFSNPLIVSRSCQILFSVFTSFVLVLNNLGLPYNPKVGEEKKNKFGTQHLQKLSVIVRKPVTCEEIPITKKGLSMTQGEDSR